MSLMSYVLIINPLQQWIFRNRVYFLRIVRKVECYFSGSSQLNALYPTAYFLLRNIYGKENFIQRDLGDPQSLLLRLLR